MVRVEVLLAREVHQTKHRIFTDLKIENWSRRTLFPIPPTARLYLIKLFSSSYPEGNCGEIPQGTICTSISLPASTRVSPDFALLDDCMDDHSLSQAEFTTCSNHSQDNGLLQVHMCVCVRVEKLKENLRNNERLACGVGVCCVVLCGEKIQG